jgi:hypothetical protein
MCPSVRGAVDTLVWSWHIRERWLMRMCAHCQCSLFCTTSVQDQGCSSVSHLAPALVTAKPAFVAGKPGPLLQFRFKQVLA